MVIQSCGGPPLGVLHMPTAAGHHPLKSYPRHEAPPQIILKSVTFTMTTESPPRAPPPPVTAPSGAGTWGVPSRPGCVGPAIKHKFESELQNCNWTMTSRLTLCIDRTRIWRGQHASRESLKRKTFPPASDHAHGAVSVTRLGRSPVEKMCHRRALAEAGRLPPPAALAAEDPLAEEGRAAASPPAAGEAGR